MGGSDENAPDEATAAAAAAGDESRGPSATPVPSMKDFAGGQVREYDELSPVFLQFLDLVHNVVAQFPTAFEFTEKLLTFIAEHAFRSVTLLIYKAVARCLGLEEDDDPC